MRFKLGKQCVWRNTKFSGEYFVDVRAIKGRNLIAAFGKLAAYASGQKVSFHTEQLRYLKRGAFELIQCTK